MSSRILMLSLAAAAVVSLPQVCHAQAYNGFYRGRSDNPVGRTVSPYLNLLSAGQGNSGVTNYQSLVKPLIEQHNALDRQGGALNRLQGQVNASAAAPRGGGGGTGHATYFMNGSHFYPAGIH